jgi:hypothetical protein
MEETNPKSHFSWTQVIVIFIVGVLFVVFIISWLCGHLASRERATRAKCLDNLRQIGLALEHYTLDFTEKTPFVSDDMEPYQSFGILYPSYSSSISVFNCPSSKDEHWDNAIARMSNKAGSPFTKDACRKSLSYAYSFNKNGSGNNMQGPWTEAAPSTVRIAADKYTCVDYSKSYDRKKSGNHKNAGRNIVRMDGSASWDDWNRMLDADPDHYGDSREYDQTGADWWSDPPEKP